MFAVFYGKINSLEVPLGPPPVNYLNGPLQTATSSRPLASSTWPYLLSASDLSKRNTKSTRASKHETENKNSAKHRTKAM